MITPLDAAYMKYLKFWLSLYGAWPYKELGQKRWVPRIRNKYTMFLISLTNTILEASYVIKNLDLPFSRLGHQYMTCLMTSVSVQRMTISWSSKYSKTIVKFINEIHLLHHRNKDDYSMKIYHQVDRISRYYTYVIAIQLMMGSILFNLAPLLLNTRKGMFDANRPVNASYESAVYYDFPFIDYEHTFSGYIIVSFYNWILVPECASHFLNFDLLLSIIVFHIWGHIKILKNNLYTCPKPSKEVNWEMDGPYFNDEEQLTIEKLLRENVIYERLIRGFMDKTASVFGVMLCYYYFFFQATLCILFLECSAMTADALLMYGVLTLTMLQQLIQVSTVFEILQFQSEGIKDAVYGLPWDCMNKKNRKTVALFLMKTQEPISLKALNIIPVGFNTMTGVLKTTYSYFIMIKTLDN